MATPKRDTKAHQSHSQSPRRIHRAQPPGGGQHPHPRLPDRRRQPKRRALRAGGCGKPGPTSRSHVAIGAGAANPPGRPTPATGIQHCDRRRRFAEPGDQQASTGHDPTPLGARHPVPAGTRPSRNPQSGRRRTRGHAAWSPAGKKIQVRKGARPGRARRRGRCAGEPRGSALVQALSQSPCRARRSALELKAWCRQKRSGRPQTRHQRRTSSSGSF